MTSVNRKGVQVNILTENQKIKLNLLKTQFVRENLWYLKQHPEIHKFLKMILSAVLLTQPKCGLRAFLCSYISDNMRYVERLLSPKTEPDPETISWRSIKAIIAESRRKKAESLFGKTEVSTTKSIVSDLKSDFNPSKIMGRSTVSQRPKAKKILGDFGFYNNLATSVNEPSYNDEEMNRVMITSPFPNDFDQRKRYTCDIDI